MQDIHRLRKWYEACKSPHCGETEPAIAEQKLGRKAREKFCHSTPEVMDVVIEAEANWTFDRALTAFISLRDTAFWALTLWPQRFLRKPSTGT
jgi:hypothetical protein